MYSSDSLVRERKKISKKSLTNPLTAEYKAYGWSVKGIIMHDGIFERWCGCIKHLNLYSTLFEWSTFLIPYVAKHLKRLPHIDPTVDPMLAKLMIQDFPLHVQEYTNSYAVKM